MGDIGKELEVVVQAMPIFIYLSSLKWVDLVDLDRLDVKKFGSPLVPYICIYICIYICMHIWGSAHSISVLSRSHSAMNLC